jgi:hypothetical protein
MGARIFISYRRNDGAGWTSKLFDALKDRFGEESIFKDYERISAGEDFEATINEQLSAADAVVAVIGRHWTGKQNWYQRSRIFQKKDWVRKELEYASVKINSIFPVLIDKATLPSEKSVPPTLVYLSALQATELRPERWDDDVAQFISQVERALASSNDDFAHIVRRRQSLAVKSRRGRRIRLAICGVAFLVLAVGMAAVEWFDDPKPPPSDVVLVPRSPASPATMDLGFWNMNRFAYSGPGRISQDIRARVPHVADALIDLDFDAVGLVDVDEEAVEELIAYLAQQGLSYGAIYEKSLAGMSTALLYRRDRLRCERAENVYADHAERLRENDPATEKRALPRNPLFANCDSARLKTPVLIVVVHFKSMFGGVDKTASRRQHASVIIGEIVNDTGNVVVGGTFHSLPDEAIQRFSGLSEVGGLRPLFAPDSDLQTFIGDPRFKSMLDYIWVSEEIRLKPIDGFAAGIVALDRSIADFVKNVSDHRPIMLSLEFDE